MRSVQIGLLALLAACCVQSCKEKANLTVYFESGCPDSNAFFTNVYVPSYHYLKGILEVGLVPWGNAQQFAPSNGYYPDTFACQHGILECHTNTFMACGREYLSFKEYNALVMCMMGTGDRELTFDSWRYCCTAHGLDYDQLYNCYNSKDGVAQSELMGQLTPPHDFIPWFELDGNTNSTVQSMAQGKVSYVQLICDSVCEDVWPQVCHDVQTGAAQFL